MVTNEIKYLLQMVFVIMAIYESTPHSFQFWCHSHFLHVLRLLYEQSLTWTQESFQQLALGVEDQIQEGQASLGDIASLFQCIAIDWKTYKSIVQNVLDCYG